MSLHVACTPTTMNGFSLLGQEKALRLLARARTGDRLAHAYLFTGPEGVGKASLARELATALLCQRAEAGSSGCGHCSSCLQMAADSHPDFLLIEPEGQGIKIDSIRRMKQDLGFSPLAGSLRVVLLKDVHTMRREAANSLLKILEEPPPGNLLLLTTDDEAGLLPTIRSRCQPIALQALPVPLCAEVIGRHAKELSPADCLALAALSDGSPGVALRMEKDGILPLHHELLQALGTESPPARGVETALFLAGRLNEHRDLAACIFHVLRQLFKNALQARLGGPAVGHGIELRERWNAEQLSAKLEAIDRAEQALLRNCNPTLVFEVLLVQLLDCFSASTQA